MKKIPWVRYLPGLPDATKILKVMKLCFVLVLTTALHVSAKTYSQRKVSLSVTNAGFEKVLDLLERKSGYSFLFNHKSVVEARKFNFQVTDVSVFEVLDKMMDSSLHYTVMDDNLIVIYPGTSPVADIEIRGSVKDTTGMGLPGVTIKIKGTSRGTITNSEGYFVLNTPDNATLVLSLMGFQSLEVPVLKRKVLDLQLKVATNDLDGVVIVAFGKQKKSDVIGAVTTINPGELKVPSSNLTTALAGRLAGVIAYQRSGEPGQDNADFFIRGVTTFGYKKDPLILIDGVELTTTDLARLQVDDIASFSIMKDATATALYGARGANGVILVTTKEGKEGKASLSFRFENTISQPTQSVKLADPITFMRHANEAALTRDPLSDLPYSEEKIDRTIKGTNKLMYPVTNWQSEIFKKYTMNQRANISVSGGGGVARYFVSAALNQDNGILHVDKRNNFNSNINLKSYSLRSNVNINLTKSTELIVRLSGTFDDYRGPMAGGADLYKKVLRTNQVLYPAYYPEDDEYSYVKHIMFGNYRAPSSATTTEYMNPYAELVKGYKESSRSNIVAQLELRQDLDFLVKGLKFRTMMNTTRTSFFDLQRAYKPYWYTATSYDKLTNDYKLIRLNDDTGTEYLDYKEGNKETSSVFYIESALSYNYNFSEKSSLNVMLVSILRSKLNGNGGSLEESLPARNAGLSGRATYAYDSRYFVEFNFGYNGSERFHEANRFGFFPSAGVGWTVSREKFFEPFSHVVRNLKFRATYGFVGNDDIGDGRFLYLSLVNMDEAARSAQFGTDNGYKKNGILVKRYADPSITWERSTKTNLGMELNLFDKFTLQADYFREFRTDILMKRNRTPATMGLTAQPETNYGRAKAAGIDLSMDYTHSLSSHSWIKAMGNFTFSRSRFVQYEEPKYDKEYWKSRIGYSLNQPWGYIAERLFVDDKEAANSPTQSFGEYRGGDIKYKDVNGDGLITELDQVPIGYPTSPEIVYGIGFSAKYRNFDISSFFQGLARESFFIDVKNTSPFSTHKEDKDERVYETQLLKAYADNHWSEENRNLYALWPRYSTSLLQNNMEQSTWFLRDGAFLRLKQVEIGYSLGKETLRRLHMKNARIYFNGNNLVTWSKFKLWDVEMAGKGLGYPVQRTFNMGVNVGL